MFSTSEIVGHRGGAPLNLLEDWFASGDGQFDSLMNFTFTNEINAEYGIELIKNYNATL